MLLWLKAFIAAAIVVGFGLIAAISPEAAGLLILGSVLVLGATANPGWWRA